MTKVKRDAMTQAYVATTSGIMVKSPIIRSSEIYKTYHKDEYVGYFGKYKEEIPGQEPKQTK